MSIVTRTLDRVVKRAVTVGSSVRSTALAMRRRRDPRVVVLLVAAFAVLSGVVVGMAARWPTAGVVVSFVLVSTAGVVVADSPRVRRRVRRSCRRAVEAVRRRLRRDESPRRDTADVESVERHLRRAGVLVDEGENRVPSVEPSFERAWRRRILSVGDRSEDEAVLADLLSAPSRAVELGWVAEEGALVATVRGTRAGRWPSRAAFVADVTAVEEFRETYPEWWALSPPMRTRALAALRLCLDWCPTCDGTVRITHVDGHTPDADSVLAATCEGCAAHLFEAELEPVHFDRPRPRDAEA